MVGLVDHRDGDVIEAHMTLRDEVLESARACHDDVDASAQGRDLRALTDAAVDGRRGEPCGASEWLDRGLHLRGELTCRQEHESAWTIRLGVLAIGGQACDEGQGEGDRLAAARASAPEDIASDQGVGQRHGLDGEG